MSNTNFALYRARYYDGPETTGEWLRADDPMVPRQVREAIQKSDAECGEVYVADNGTWQWRHVGA